MKPSVIPCRSQVFRPRSAAGEDFAAATGARFAEAFSLVEVLLVVTLLSLIVLALMNVFSSTQAAFRASVTQTDVLEGSRSAMELITQDLRGMTTSGGFSNINTFGLPNAAVNFATLANGNASSSYVPLVQTLPASSSSRSDVLNYFFVLGRNNNQWTGIGYVVDNTNTATLYPLYRFFAQTNLNTSPFVLYNQFRNVVLNSQWTNMSHVMDGVVHLVARARDPRGNWINFGAHGYTNAFNLYFANSASTANGYGEAQFYMFSNTVPAAVELQLGVLEDQAIQRAQAFPNFTARTNYLAGQAGRTHLFRQLVTIPNADPSAYQ